MTVLVTGAGGFIGTRVTQNLLQRGEAVVYFDLFGNPARLGEFAQHPGLRVVRGDVTRFDDLVNTFARNKIKRVIHVAALLTVDIEAEPRLGIRINVGGMSNVLEVARYFGIERVVYASSIAVYGDQSDHGEHFINEDSALHPQTLYAHSKLLNEVMARDYAKKFGLDCRGLRICTVFGWGRETGLSAEVSRVISQPAIGESVELRLSPAETSPLIYVDDVAECLVRLCLAEKLGHPIYVSPASTASLRDLADMVRRFAPGAEISFAKDGGVIPHVYKIDSRSIQQDTGYVLPPLEKRVRDHVDEARRSKGIGNRAQA
jgi:nucleoside-diphosphate-sugar epimerase